MDCLKFVFSYLLLALMTGYGIVAVLSTCPNDRSVKERVDAVEAVQVNLRNVFSKILKNSTIANDSLSTIELYQQIATGVGLSTTLSGFVQFREAISEVAVAKYHADLRIERNTSVVTTEYISKLKENFMMSTAVKNTGMAREVFGEMICIGGLSSSADRKKRQVGVSNEINEFFDSLNATHASTIFGFDPVEGTRPSLAFVVDNTGSMSNEINAVTQIVKDFLKTERADHRVYILTTFNDPGISYGHNLCFVVYCIYILPYYRCWYSTKLLYKGFGSA